MALIGKTNRMIILAYSDFGLLLDGGDRLGEVLLPNRYVDPEWEPGDEIDAFLYTDSEDRVIATTERPLAEAGEFALLEVVDLGRAGAFLGWGLPKDLLLPRSEQKDRPEKGQSLVVQVKFDKASDRVYATQKLNLGRDAEIPEYQPGEGVDALVATRSEIGWTAVVDGRYLGLFFHNEVFRDLHQGLQVRAYVKEVREEDGRIDLTLDAPGYQGKIPPLRNQLLDALRDGGGFLSLHDRSDPAEIQAALGCSKKNFKKAVGALYREGLIDLVEGGIRERKG